MRIVITWWLLVKLLRIWANRYLDQFEMVQFQTKNGPVYVNIGRSTTHPDAFDKIDKNGNPTALTKKF